MLEPTDQDGIVSVRPVSLSEDVLEEALDDLVAAVTRRDDTAAAERLHAVVTAATRVPAAGSAADRRIRAAFRP